MGGGKCVQPKDKDVGDRPLCTSLVSRLFAKIDSLTISGHAGLESFPFAIFEGCRKVDQA